MDRRQKEGNTAAHTFCVVCVFVVMPGLPEVQRNVAAWFIK